MKNSTSSTIASVEPGGGATRPQQFEFLALTLGREEYGVDIQRVQELCGYNALTRIANAPEFIKGVVNLRGSIAPIIDMRIRFGLGTPVYDQFTVDSVSDVITLRPEQVKPAPQLRTAMVTDFLIGMGALTNGCRFLIDIDQSMSGTDFGFIEKLAA